MRTLIFPLPPVLLVLLVSLSTKGQEPPPAAVAVERVVEGDLAPRATVLGATEPRRTSDVAASIEGYVVDHAVREGQRVKTGDLLVGLRDDVLRLELQEARALLEERQERHKRARLDLERARELISKDAVTQKSLDAALADERALAAQIVQAEARVAVLEADLAKKRVVAPFAGQIVREHAELGEWVERGGVVATVVDLASVFIRVHVPERHVRFVREGEELDVHIAAAGEEARRGRVDAVSGAGDPVARTFAVRVEVPNPDGAIRAGMSAEVRIPTGAPRRGLVVSKDAVLLRGAQAYVYVLGAGDRVEERIVETGAASGERFEVLAGLTADDMVVVEGNERLRPGMAVRIVPRSGEGRSRS